MHVSKLFSFEASHILSKHPGKCHQLHGHSWRVEVVVSGPVQEETQFVLDYAQLGEIVQPFIELLDHRHLNLFVTYPSSENVARYLAFNLHRIIDGTVITRLQIRVSETAKTWCEWDSAERRDVEQMMRNTEKFMPPIMNLEGVDPESWVSLGVPVVYQAKDITANLALEIQVRRIVKGMVNEIRRQSLDHISGGGKVVSE